MRAVLLLGCLALLCPAGSAAQLASPGPLSRAHSGLEGLRNCTACHELRRAGIAPGRCLSCHAPLARRVRARQGLHGRLGERDCAVCHREHIGPAADIVRLDTTAFRHERTGWPLRGAHAALGCRACHTAAAVRAADVRDYAPTASYLANTYLGLAAECRACHLEDSPHEAASNQEPCGRCHDETDWRVDRFDHDSTSFPLAGAHRGLACGDCHRREEQTRLSGIAHASCGDCHRDPHAGRFGPGCTGCHRTSGWRQVAAGQVAARFDHASTRFPLRDAHAAAPCAACHDRGRAGRAGMRIVYRPGSEAATFPAPLVTGCGSCHADFHQGQLRSGAASCDRCHDGRSWLPVRFDVTRHQRETTFPLEGGHLAVPCGDCHVRPQPGFPPQVRWPDLDCRACHAADDPHAGMFGPQPCSGCHRAGIFEGASFDHGSVRDSRCDSCHRDDDPHAGQFPARSCDACHATDSFRIERFDHTGTRFPLTGAHARAACRACHRPDAAGAIRYRPLPLDCAGCHGGLQ